MKDFFKNLIKLPRPHTLLTAILMLACGVWFLILAVFMSTLEDGLHAVFSSVLCMGGAVAFYLAADKLILHLPPLLQKRRFWLFFLVLTVIYTVFSLKTPYSPAHDSYDMTGFLNQLLNGDGFSGYARAYLSFTATNKLTLFIYYPFVWLFQSVKTGTQVLNFLLILSSLYFISGSMSKMFGKIFGEISLFVALPFVPYLMLTGPYIYPPSIFIASLALYLYHCKPLTAKIFGYICFGFLFIIRPTALGFMIVYITIYTFLCVKSKNRVFYTLERLTLLFVFCILVKSIFGMTMFYTGWYPYPNLKTSAMMWTAELGTRMQGEETGKCTYSGYSKKFDEVSWDFYRLWNIYSRENPDDVKTIDYIHDNIKENIIARTKSTVLDTSEHFNYFIKTKYKNLFANEYKPYYYMTNITSKNFGENLSKNYEKRYFLYENILLITFSLSALTAVGIAFYQLIRKKKLNPHIKHALSLAVGVMAVFVVFVLFTEVGKRLIFDVFTPMLMLICYIGGVIVQTTDKHFPSKSYKFTDICTIVAISLTLGVYYFYNYNNIDEFKNVKVQYVNRHIRLVFPKEVTGDYRIWEENDSEFGGRNIFLKGKTEITLEAQKFDKKEIELRLPNGELYMITNLKEY